MNMDNDSLMTMELRETAVSICLDGNHVVDISTGSPIFLPGQEVRGNAIYEVFSPVSIVEARMHFRGICTTQVVVPDPKRPAAKLRFKEEVELFHGSTILVTGGPFLIQPGTYEWPFGFTFPDSSTHCREPKDEYDKLYNAEPQYLPPSMQSAGSLWNKAKITYRIHFEVSKAYPSAIATASLPLLLTPSSKYVSPQSPTPPIELGVSTFKSKQLRERKLSIGQKLKSFFLPMHPSFATPAISLSAALLMPSQASIWQPMSISLSVQQQRTGQNDPTLPKLRLRKVVLELEAHTDMRVSASSNTYNESVHSITGRIIIPGNNTPVLFDPLISVAEEVKLGDMLLERNGILVPSFTSYTVHHHYQMIVKVALEHVGSGYVFDFEGKMPFCVLEVGNPWVSLLEEEESVDDLAEEEPLAGKEEAS